MKNKSLKVIFGVALTSAICHLPGDINNGGKAIKDYSRQKTFVRAYDAAAALNVLSSPLATDCWQADYNYRRVLENPAYSAFGETVKQTGERFYTACKPLIR